MSIMQITLYSNHLVLTNKSIEVDDKELVIEREDLLIDAIESEAHLQAQTCEMLKPTRMIIWQLFVMDATKYIIHIVWIHLSKRYHLRNIGFVWIVII